jgi:hypothetical protein
MVASGHGDGVRFAWERDLTAPPGQVGLLFSASFSGFYSHVTQAAGIVSCAVSSDQRGLCTPIMDDFQTRYGPPPPPACTASQLRVANAASNGAGGTLLYGVDVTNTTPYPCTFSGYPSSLAGVQDTGAIVDLHPDKTLTNANGNAEGILAPNHQGSVTIGTNNACDGKRALVIPGTFTGLRIGFPGGGSLTVQGSYRFECRAMVSPMGVYPQV